MPFYAVNFIFIFLTAHFCFHELDTDGRRPERPTADAFVTKIRFKTVCFPFAFPFFRGRRRMPNLIQMTGETISTWPN